MAFSVFSITLKAQVSCAGYSGTLKLLTPSACSLTVNNQLIVGSYATFGTDVTIGGNVYATGNVTGSWAGNIVSQARGGTGYSSLYAGMASNGYSSAMMDTNGVMLTIYKAMLTYQAKGSYITDTTALLRKSTAIVMYQPIGNYYPLSGNPSNFLTSVPVQSWSSITGKPAFATIATSGLYSDLTGQPTNLSSFTNGPGYITVVPAQAWVSITGKPSFGLAATSNLYSDLTGLPSIPASQVNTDWSSASGVSQILNKPTLQNLTAGGNISIASNAINNTAPDQVVTLTGSNGLIISGTYPNFAISKKRQETYTGTTVTAGTYTVTYATSYSATPNVQFQINGGTNKQTILLSSSTPSGFTVYVQARTDVLGLLPSYSNVSGAIVDMLVTEK